MLYDILMSKGDSTMEEKLYTISQLEQLTGIRRRIIHFYVKEKVIPPPIGTKGTARYTEKQFLSLQLIKYLKKAHLKLAGIKETLEALSIEEMKSVLAKAQKSAPEEWDGESLGKWVEPPQKMEFREAGAPYGREASYLKDLKRNLAATETWERVQIMAGIELHVRHDLMKQYKTVITNFINTLKQRLQQEDRL